MNRIDRRDAAPGRGRDTPIRIAILDDHPGIIDGYRFRLEKEADMSVVADTAYGEDLEPMLTDNAVDLLILDVYVPTSPQNANPYPILYMIPRLLDRYPSLVVIVISVVSSPAMIKAVLDAGASGYLLKDDIQAYQNLGNIIRSVVQEGFYLSEEAHRNFSRQNPVEADLTPRQREALSLCAAYPELKTAQLARRMGVAHSTFRNLLSGGYFQLNVANRAAAIVKAQQLGLLPAIGPDN